MKKVFSAMLLAVMMLTMTAQTAQVQYTLTLDYNYDGGQVEVIPYLNPDAHITLPKPAENLRPNNTFQGWSTSSKGFVEYRSGESITITGDLEHTVSGTLCYSVWRRTRPSNAPCAATTRNWFPNFRQYKCGKRTRSTLMPKQHEGVFWVVEGTVPWVSTNFSFAAINLYYSVY